MQMVTDTFGRIKGLVAMQPGAHRFPFFRGCPQLGERRSPASPACSIVSPEIWTRANVIDGKMIISPPRFLFGADIPTRLHLKQGVYRNDIVAGRFLTEKRPRHAEHRHQPTDCRRVSQRRRRHADRQRIRPENRRGLLLRIAAVGRRHHRRYQRSPARSTGSARTRSPPSTSSRPAT